MAKRGMLMQDKKVKKATGDSVDKGTKAFRDPEISWQELVALGLMEVGSTEGGLIILRLTALGQAVYGGTHPRAWTN